MCATNLFYINLPETEVDIFGASGSGWNTLKKTAITDLLIPSKVAGSILSSGSDSFSFCPNLRTVRFAENSVFQTVNTRTFYNCPKLVNITFPNSLTSIVRPGAMSADYFMTGNTGIKVIKI